MAQKLIFLDFDGVLVIGGTNPPSGQPPDPACVKAFNRIAALVAGIVVVSNWRLFYELSELRQFGELWGLQAPIFDTTHARMETREAELKSWLGEEHPKLGSMVIIDDDHEYGDLEYCRVRPDTQVGLSEEQADMAIGILNGN